MKLPADWQWTRVEHLADQCSQLPPEEAALFLARLADAGEPPTVLTTLSQWLSLPPLPTPFAAGTEIGGSYILKEKLGESGMGSVWRAEQKLVDRDVALKMIHPALVTPDLNARFVKEIKLLGQFKHPGIVRIFEAGLHSTEDFPPVPFFTMELVEGWPLDRWAAAHRQDRLVLLRVIQAVCEAVQSAHERRIVHRDLKPSNILVQADGRPMVLDFGIARLTAAGGSSAVESFSGTPQYAAPEQHLGRDLEFRSGESVDVYSTGAILFQMLTGRLLFEFPRGASLAEMRRIVLEETIPNLSALVPDCPPSLNEITGRALRRNPADRFLTMSSFGKAIGRVLAELDKTSVAPPPWRPAEEAIIPGTEWKLEKLIGEGGAGEVWLGRHAELRQRRVFKFCNNQEKARTLKRELTLYRLLKEEIGQNPHFIPLHDVSLDDAPWYLMMDHVEARDLAAWGNAQIGGLAAVPESQRLEIVAQAAEALQAAHDAGILHRDIKPGNLLIREDGGEAKLHVLIADFGIGQIVSNELVGQGTRLGFTRTVTDLPLTVVSGTLLYLAPEVSQGKAATARSDIYSLGVVLWQLLVGDLGAALDATGWSSRIADPLLRDDLLKCLSASPEKRWSSAGELAASLRALGERRSEAQRREDELKKLKRKASIKAAAFTAGVASLIITSVIVLAWFAIKQSEIASIERTRATLGELQAVAELRSSEARSRLFSEMPKLEVQKAGLELPLREVAIRILALPVFDDVGPESFHLNGSSSIADRGERLIGRSPQGIKVLDLAADTPKELVYSGEAAFSGLRVNMSGLAAGGVTDQGALHLWSGGQTVKTYIVPGPIHADCFALSPLTLTRSRSVLVAAARPDSSIDVFLLGQTNHPLTLLRRSSENEPQFPESCPATMLSFSLTQEGILAAAGPGGGHVLFWRIADQRSRALDGQLAGAAWHPDDITCLKWNPVTDELATGCRDGNLRIWRFSFTGESPQTTPIHRVDLAERIRDVAWSPDGNLIGVLLESGRMSVLQAKVPTQPAISTLHFPGAAHLAFLAGNRLLAWGTNGQRAWGSREEQYFSERRGSAGAVHVDFQEEGALTMTGIERTEFLNPSTLAWTAGFKTESLAHGAWQGPCLYFHSNDKWNVACFEREAEKPNSLRLPKGPKGVPSVDQIIASPQGKRAAWVDGNQLSCRQGEIEEGIPAGLPAPPRLVAVSDREPKTAWMANSGPLHLFDHNKGSEQNLDLDDDVLWLTFDPASALLACRTGKGIIFINSTNLQRVSCALPAPGSNPTPIAISPDGQSIVVSQADHNLLIASLPAAGRRWQDGGASLAAVFAHATPLRSPYPRRLVSLDWNAAGSRLAAGTADGFVQTWNVSLLRTQLRLWKLDWGEKVPPPETGFAPVRLN